MSQRTTTTASTEKISANQAATRVKPEQRGQQPAFQQNLLHLQQFVGNRATQGLLSAGLLQAKLRIGPTGDSFEREADRMADAVLRMPKPGAGGNATQVAQVRSGNVQRVCFECEEELRRQPMEEEDEELLQAKRSSNASPPVNAGVESRIASLHGGGRPLSPAQRSFFEPRFNHDFSDVRVHTGGMAAESARAIKARAFTVGRDIAFGAGQYAPASRSGRQLLAHELTHTIQQTPLVARRKPLIQRQPETSPGVDSTVGETESQFPTEGPVEQPEQTPASPETRPETPVPEGTPAAGLIVGDETSELGPGQMGKRAFLAELRSGICTAADEPLAGTQYTAQGCPTIELYLRIYEGFSAERIEQDMVRLMPEAAGITDARQYIPLMAARVRRSVAVWVQTGEITGVPEGLPTGLPGLGVLARILFKGRNGGPRGNPNPQAVQAQLGAGRPMNSSVSSRMGSAFGRSFSNVRVHTDATAGQLSNRFNARAFTVGNQIAFGTGEYRPGTLMGDALIAHELAHTVQQGGANASVAPMQPGNTGTTSLEKDADRSAISAVASMWGGGVKSGLKNIAKNAIPRLRSGLSLQRCKRKTGRRILTAPSRVLDILCNPQDRHVIETIQTENVKVIFFRTAFDEWRYDDGRREVVELHGLMGNTKRSEKEIRIRESLSDQRKATTLFHEMGHFTRPTSLTRQQGLDQEAAVRIDTEHFSIRHGFPPAHPRYRRLDDSVDEAFIRHHVKNSPHYNPVGRRRIGRTYEDEAVTRGWQCPSP